MSKAVLNAKSSRQTSHKGKHPYNVSTYQQEKAHFNTYPWILSQTCPGQRVSTVYSQSSIKGVQKQPSSSLVTKQLMVQM